MEGENQNNELIRQEGNEITNGDLAGRDVNKQTYQIGRIPFSGQNTLLNLYEKLKAEENEVFTEIVDELMHFKNHASNTPFIGLEAKLESGNRTVYLQFAEVAKEKFTKKMMKNEHSETAQYIYAFLLAKVYSRFQTSIYPRLSEGHPDTFITSLILETIINPLEDLLGENLLRLYEDEIHGMIYFLTGNCHIKWN